MLRYLGELNPGERARVTGFEQGDRAFRQKLLAMGLTTGAELDVVRVAPLGDPMEIRVRGSSLSLRREEAAIVRIENL
jgi:ferrous iron transport protein A